MAAVGEAEGRAVVTPNAEKYAATLAEVAALADRWEAVLAECKEADPRWILDSGVMALNTCLTELRSVLPPAEEFTVRRMEDGHLSIIVEDDTAPIPPGGEP